VVKGAAGRFMGARKAHGLPVIIPKLEAISERKFSL